MQHKSSHIKRFICLSLSVVWVLISISLHAQNGNQIYSPVIGSTASSAQVKGGAVISTSTFSPMSALTDGDLTNYAANTELLTALSADGVAVTSTSTFSSGWRAGYVVEITGGLLSTNVLNAITLQTRYNNTIVDTKTTANGLDVTLIGATNSGKLYLNFASSGAFNEIRFYFNNVASLSLLANSVRVYYAMAFDPNGGINESNNICDDQIAGTGTVVNFNAGLLGVLGSLTNRDNLVNGNKNSAATLTLPVGTSLLSTSIYVGVTDLFNVYPAGNKAGFVVGINSSLLTATILNNIKIQTYLFGDFVGEGSFNSGSGLLNVSALSVSSASNTKRLEFTSPGKFNEVRIVFASGISTDVSLSNVDLYYAYESGSSCDDCSKGLYTSSSSPYTGTIVAGETGLVGGLLCIGASVSNTGNVTSSSQTDYATISALVGLLCTGEITVSTAGSFPAGTFAGFEIAQDNSGLFGLLSASALNAITVRAYNGTTQVGSATGASLLNAGVLAGVSGKTVIGFKPTATFNKIRIEVSMGLVSVATAYRIYRAFVIEDSDNDGTPNCYDQCAGSDAIDTDGDGIPDNCDVCSNAAAPVLSAYALTNVCNATTANLSSITASNTPSGATLSWHTAIPASTSNKISDPSSISAPGIYYAAFQLSSGCYSGSGIATASVTVTKVNCGGTLTANTPAIITVNAGSSLMQTAVSDMNVTGGLEAYSFSLATNDASCIAPYGATALPSSSNLTITNSTTGEHTFTAPAAAGTYYYCIKVCDSNTNPQQCLVRTYTVVVTDPCNASSQVLIKQ